MSVDREPNAQAGWSRPMTSPSASFTHISMPPPDVLGVLQHLVCTPSVMVLLLGCSSPHAPRRLSDRVSDANGPTRRGAGPFDEAFPAGASASIEASSGGPTGTREVGELVGFCRLPGERAGAGDPGPRGTAQQPVTSRVSSCFGKDHPLSPVHAWCGRTRGKATNEVTTISEGGVARTTERTGSGCQPRNRYPAPRTVSTTSRRSFLRR
jgi:hypothetical protein